MPCQLNPDRARAERVAERDSPLAMVSIAGPVARVALTEAEVFLDRLLRLPGLRMAGAPDVGWNPLATGYGLRACELIVEEAR